MTSDSLQRWKISAMVATLVIILCFPLARWRQSALQNEAALAEPAAVTYVGRRKCIECHEKAGRDWQGSDHDMAMDVATPETVLGDFNDAVFQMDGYQSRYFRKDGKYYVNTEGADGELADFQVTHVFGVRPLQQYLIPFPGGRYQVLGSAWDTENKVWFDMYPAEDIEAGDWLHWTRQAQNWNSMCADCHSTNVDKGFDMASGSYRTSWSEIDVSCETCHGPGSAHVEWAEVPPMGRTQSVDLGLQVRTGNLSARREVELCAPCHSRRYLLGPLDPTDSDLLDKQVPALLREGLYHPDGQILDEVYVYGSFVQSKMHRMEVRCSDCHDVHSLKLHKQNNDLCLQCHQATTYNSSDHHFHKKTHEGKPSAAWLCVKCHMPEQPFMVVDWRADHSLRIPRPDLSRDLKVPNACNDQPGCHGDKSVDWSVRSMQKWYGERKRPHYGEVLAAGRRGLPAAEDELIAVAGDRLYPNLARATAIDLLSAYAGPKTLDSLNLALMDEEALVRLGALRTLNTLRHPGQAEMVAPLLYDDVEAVRIEAAVNLSRADRDRLNPAEREVYERNLQRYREVMEYSADFTFGRFNLANLEMKLGNNDLAEEHYLAAIAIDELFYPAKANLAMLYNSSGRNAEAEQQLREILQADPQRYDIAYNLGLLLTEMERMDEAAAYMRIAAEGFGNRGRIFYNLGLALQASGRDQESEQALLRALALEPANADFLYALADYYLKRRQYPQLRTIAAQARRELPSHPLGKDLFDLLNRLGQ
jgi:Tfp pilus assembly protein PilF